MKDVSYEMKQLNRFTYWSKETLETCIYADYALRLQEERQK